MIGSVSLPCPRFGLICRLVAVSLAVAMLPPAAFRVPVDLLAALGPSPAHAQGPAALSPDIAVSRTVTPATTAAVQANRVTVTYTVFNRQATPLTGALLATTLEPGVALAAASPEPDRAGQGLAWNLGTLGAFASATVQVTVALPNPIPLQLDSGARTFAVRSARAVSATAPAATLRPGAVDENLLRSTPDASTTDPFVLARAAQLGHDPARIFAFLRDEIGYEAYRGSLRGARGAFWSRAGNALDRASLMIALLRASGIPARYARGTLPDPLARQLIGSMFPPTFEVAGVLPAGTAGADPASDPVLLAEAREHFWVEIDTGGGFQAADPSFPGASLGQAFTASTGTFAEVPDELRHKVTIRLNRELASQATAIFGVNPLGTATVLDRTFPTVRLVGRPLSLGHLVNQTAFGAVFTSVTNTYAPYLALASDSLDSSQDEVFRGTDYQEALTNFPLGNEVLTGLFLEVDLVHPDGTVETHTRELLDRIGFAIRQHGGVPDLGLDPAGAPAITDLDVVTIHIAPSLQDPTLDIQLAQALQAEGEQLTGLLANASSPSPASLLLIRRVMMDTTRYKGFTQLAGSDLLTTRAARGLLVKAYADQPRVILTSSRLALDPGGQSGRLAFATDLRRDRLRVLAFPGQNPDVTRTFQGVRGLLMAYTEADDAPLPPGMGVQAHEPVSTVAIMRRAETAGIPLLGITGADVALVAALDLPADGRGRIIAALQRGRQVIVPARGVVLNGQPRSGWLEIDPLTGEIIGVTDDGGHQAIASYGSVVADAAFAVGATLFGQAVGAYAALVTVILPGKVIWELCRLAEGASDPSIAGADSRERCKAHQAAYYTDARQKILALQPASGSFVDGFIATLEVALRRLLAQDPPLGGELSAAVLPPLFPPERSFMDLAVSPTRTGGTIAGTVPASDFSLDGQLTAAWSSTATGTLAATSLEASGVVSDASGATVGSGAITLSAATPVDIQVSGGVTYAVSGTGQLSFYAAATTDLGVSAEWAGYTATVDGSVALRVTSDVLRVNGATLPAGTYTISTGTATVHGRGPSTSPTFIGTAIAGIADGGVRIGTASGTLAVNGSNVEGARLTLDGFTGTATVTAGPMADSVALDGTASHVMRLRTSPAAVSIDQNTAASVTAQVETSLADTYRLVAEAPAGWEVAISALGALSVRPAPGLQSGTGVIRLTAIARTSPTVTASADVTVTIGPTSPGVTVQIEPDPLFTIPVGSAQLATAFQVAIRNLGPAADRFSLAFPTVPPGFEILAPQALVDIPAGETGMIGVYLRPTGQIAPPGTPVAFAASATSTTNAAVTATDTESFALPAIHGVIVAVEPALLGSTPGTPVDALLTLMAVGNVAEDVSLAASAPASLSLAGLTSPVALTPGQTITQPLTLTPAAGVALNSTLGASITATFGPPGAPFAARAQVTVQVVVPGAAAAIDAAAAARGGGQGELADALRNLGLGITDLFGAPGDPVLRGRVTAEIGRVTELLVDPSFAALAGQLDAIRTAIASGTPQSLPGDLAALDAVLNEVGHTSAALGRHRFEARLEPNSRIASPLVPATFVLSIANRGAEATTYTLSVEGLPPGVTSELSAPSVTLAPGEASSNLTVTLTQTSAAALVPVGFDVRIAPAPAPEIGRSVSGSLTARAEIVSVVAVAATPPFAPAGTPRDLTARLLNAVNQTRSASIDFTVKDPTGTIARQGTSAPFELGVLASLVTIDLGSLDTTGLAAGAYTIDVAAKDAGGAPIPGATGTGAFLIGTPVTASITVDPEIGPAGTRTVNAALQIDSQVPLATEFTQIAQLAGPAHSVAVKGDLAYVCGPNGGQIVRVSDPENPVVEGTFGTGQIAGSGFTHCKVSGDQLIVRSSTSNNASMFLRVYSLANPAAPQLLSATPARADYPFAADLVVAGSTVLVPTNGFCFTTPGFDVFEHWGDLLAFDLADPAAPALAGALFDGPPRNLSGCVARGGPSNMFQAALADPTTVLVATTTVAGTSPGIGVGRLRVIDIANPAQMAAVDAGELRIPGTAHLIALATDGALGLALGSTGGWNEFQQDLGLTGTVVMATVDLTNPRQPALLATRALDRRSRGLNRLESVGNGIFIASSLGGAGDSPRVLLIDARDPRNPIAIQVDVPVDILITAVAEDLVYATSAAGFSIYRLGSIGTMPVTAQVQIPRGTGVAIVPGSFNEDPDEVVTGAQFDTLVWRRGLGAGATSLAFTWREQVADVQPGEAREVTVDTAIDFASEGTDGRIALAPLSVLAEQVLSLDPPSRTVRPGEAASYTVTLKNPAAFSITYALAVEGVPAGWVTLPGAVVAPPGSTQQLSLTLRSEALAALGEYGFAVNAQGLGFQASVLGTLALAGDPVLPDGDVRGVVASLNHTQVTAGQGTAALFTLRVTNVGSVGDIYAVTVAAPAGFTVTATPASVEVPPGIGNFKDIALAIAPPLGTPTGTVAISARATSTSDATVFAEAPGTVAVVAAGVTVALSPTAGPPGSRFQMTVRNTGTTSETFDLALGGPAGVASTLGASSLTLASGASQLVPVDVGPVNFATPGGLGLTAVATARSNAAVRASATAQVSIGETAGIAASFDPALITLPIPGGAIFLLDVQSTGNREDGYQASIVATSGPIAATLLDLNGRPAPSVPVFRIPGLAAAALVLDAMLQAFGQGTVTVRVQSLTDPGVTTEATATLRSAFTNAPPAANAGGDQQVPFGAVVTLDGTASDDPDAAPRPLTFAWAFVSTPPGSALGNDDLTGATSAGPSFEPDVRGDYRLRLTLSDGEASGTDEVLVRVLNNAPVAVAGRDRNGATGMPAPLDGSDSFDPDGDLIGYEWSFEAVPAGSALTTGAIAGRTGPDPSFVPDVVGAYVLKLVVHDPEATSAASLTTVRAWAANVPPNANAGPDRHVAVGAVAALDAGASQDPDAGPVPLTFAWTVVAVPAGSQVTGASLVGADQAQASFTPDLAGDYRLIVRVGDGQAFAENEVIVTAHAENVAPNASAGLNVDASAGVAVTLDGSASQDPDAAPAPLAYRWRFVSLPPGSALTNTHIANPEAAQAQFTPDVVGPYVLELTVFDGAAGDGDNVMVVVRAPDAPVCFGRPATIFVRDGVIAGGPDGGKPYRGTLRGTPGDDVIIGTAGRDHIKGNGGNDVLCGGDGDDVIDGGSGHDLVDGGPGKDLIRTYGGNDHILGGEGNDTIEGGDGDDEIDGGPGKDLIKGQGGRDLLRGGDGDDTIEGGVGNDTVQGNGGADTLRGMEGDDVLDGGPGADRLDGGLGTDECRDEGRTLKNCER